MTRSLWRTAEELRIRVPAWAQVGFVSILKKCPGIVKLSLKRERSVVNFVSIFPSAYCAYYFSNVVFLAG